MWKLWQITHNLNIKPSASVKSIPILLQVVLLCWGHGLYDAIIYVYNKGMFDYVTPLEELLSTLKAAVDTGKQLTGT